MASALVLRRALEISKGQLASYEQWVEDCEKDRAAGFRAHYCEHGMDQWVDYDNICGGCEDGVSMGRGLDRYEFALGQAKWQFDGRRMPLDLSAATRDRLSDIKIKGRAILEYLLTLPADVRDSVKLDAEENRAYFSYLRWMMEEIH